MSLMRTMYSGVSGLLANSQALGIVGDNIANVNTVGYKGSRAVFADMMGQVTPGAAAAQQVGSGVRLVDVQQLFQQGALLTTDSQADLAISGQGFFAVRGNISGQDGTFYTRAGQFHLDQDGFMVDGSGLRLQGYGVTETGDIDTRVEDLQIGDAELTPNATTAVDISANLDSTETAIAAGAGGIDPEDPSTYHYSTSMTVYDSLGEAHRIDVFFVKTADNTWEYAAYGQGDEVVGGTPGALFELTAGGDGLTFTAGGELDTETGGALAVTFTGGAAAQTIQLDFGESITTDGGTGLGGTSQFAEASSLSGITQDGYAAGTVLGFSIGSDGVVTGVYDNGQQRTLGQVVLATFASEEGLTRVGDNAWAASHDSGPALIGEPTTGGRGGIVQGALEQSNVDIATEFVRMISFQRGFQANSKTVTTADEMYQDAIHLKR